MTVAQMEARIAELEAKNAELEKKLEKLDMEKEWIRMDLITESQGNITYKKELSKRLANTVEDLEWAKTAEFNQENFEFIINLYGLNVRILKKAGLVQ